MLFFTLLLHEQNAFLVTLFHLFALLFDFLNVLLIHSFCLFNERLVIRLTLLLFLVQLLDT
jgi:hypothetical protein